MTSKNYDSDQLKSILSRELHEMMASGELDPDIARNEREQMAEGAFVARDARKMSEGDHESASAYILSEYGVNVEDYGTREELHAALAAKRNELREQQVGRRPIGRGGD